MSETERGNGTTRGVLNKGLLRIPYLIIIIMNGLHVAQTDIMSNCEYVEEHENKNYKDTQSGCFKLQWNESVNNGNRGETAVPYLWIRYRVGIQWWHADCSDDMQTAGTGGRLKWWHADCSDGRQTKVMTCRLQGREAD